MSSISTIRVPEGMSCINAFHALWENSRTTYLVTFNQESNNPLAHFVKTPEKVADLFKTYTYFDFVGGKLLETDFSKFPELAVGLYDRDFGNGAAQKALENYNKIPSSERFDKYDSYKFEDLKKN